jgi:hypothetical protein
MNIVACSISRSADPCQTKIFKNLQKINKHSENKIDLKLKHNNTKTGLCEFYNKCIDEHAKICDYMILVHDDVEFINMDLAYQIEQGMQKYDILGVAGCIDPTIKDDNLWHLMTDRSKLRGFAGHPCSNDPEEFYVTVFGPSPNRVAMIDGVVMVLNCKKILESNTRFDENYMFHHYDLDFSIQCNINKLKIGTWPILINHSSPGLKERHKGWSDSNEYFKNKWKKILQK